MNLNLIFLDGAPAGPMGDQSWMIMMGLVFVVMYFFMIRPQSQKQKKTKKLIEELKVGDKVVTIGGLHGSVVTLDDAQFVMEVQSGAKIKVDKSAIALDTTMAAYGEAKK